MSDEKIIVGKINGFHGVRGFIKVFSETRPREGILEYSRFFMKQGNEWITLEVDGRQKHNKHVLLKFEGYDSRDAVEPLLGQELYISREDMPELEDGVYWLDLYGLKVINHEGVELGEIADIFETGANDVITVKGAKGEMMIPFSMEYIVMEINLEEGYVQVDWDEE
ncbi:ribosome maturation factor RimM [Ignatzschineria indica]|uniref:Ribosome maturation factor RimM n=1 Tax=Ignatzschineria indica TaxID=472583 RepID=A0A2U2ANH5_9GAMM|nr:ribosome maturation factor RimM [Ignatzschineria indica]PWD84754.1 16S rRNA processing protein RimM [Ignatzschineria indica]GGZ78926.1 ribosome maturation factor RimM [Ignatzschineria indica]